MNGTLGSAFDWLVRYAMLASVAYAIYVIHHERARACAEADRRWCVRLAELLPLPHLGDRGTLLVMLQDVVPEHDLALYAAGEPALLIARRPASSSLGPEAARWIEVHRDALQGGQIVREPGCGTLVPLRLRDGALTGALIVDTQRPVPLDVTAQATLRHIAALVGPTPARVALAWAQKSIRG